MSNRTPPGMSIKKFLCAWYSDDAIVHHYSLVELIAIKHDFVIH